MNKTTFTVKINASGVNSIEPESNTLSVEDNFTLKIANEGAPSHVYVDVSDNLDPYVSLRGTNLYIENEETIEIIVGPGSETVEGRLEITTGYGSKTEVVNLVIEEEGDSPVEVDESLSQPKGEEIEREGGLSQATWAIIGIAVMAVLLGLAVGVFADPVGGVVVALLVLIVGAIIHTMWPESKD